MVEYLKPFLYEIDFLSMGLEVLLEKLPLKNLFTDEEILSIILAKQVVDLKRNNILPNYPSYLRSEPRSRRFNHQGPILNYCKIITNSQCALPSTGRVNPSDKVLFAFQTSADIKLYEVRASSECFRKKCILEVDNSNGGLLAACYSSSISDSIWSFSSPVNIKKDTWYIVRIGGKNSILKHDEKMFSINRSNVEFSGVSILCDIDIGFRV